MLHDIAYKDMFHPVGKLIAINCKKNCNLIANFILQLKHTKFGRIAIHCNSLFAINELQFNELQFNELQFNELQLKHTKFGRIAINEIAINELQLMNCNLMNCNLMNCNLMNCH